MEPQTVVREHDAIYDKKREKYKCVVCFRTGFVSIKGLRRHMTEMHKTKLLIHGENDKPAAVKPEPAQADQIAAPPGEKQQEVPHNWKPPQGPPAAIQGLKLADVLAAIQEIPSPEGNSEFSQGFHYHNKLVEHTLKRNFK